MRESAAVHAVSRSAGSLERCRAALIQVWLYGRLGEATLSH